MKRFTFLVMILILVLFMNTDYHRNITDSDRAISYLVNMGYQMIADRGKAADYVLTKEKVLDLPYMEYWSVQKADAKDYLGKTISNYQFTIKNHPLDSMEGNERKQTRVCVMVCEHKVVGGFALPDIDDLMGWVYSIDGKTLEELTGVVDYPTWRAQWIGKYQ